MNTETIIAELRRINAWRRGGEEIEQPDPKHIGEVLDAAADSLRSLIASNTTLRSGRGEARAEVAQLKGALALVQENCDAEYEALRRERDTARDGLRDSHIHAEQLEASVKELEANLTNQKLEAAMEQLAALRAANAELANKLENCIGMLEELEDCDWGDCGMPFTIDWDSLRSVLARHAAGEPAKHPDTDWLSALDYNTRTLICAIAKAGCEYKDTSFDDEWLRVSLAPPGRGDFQLGDLRRLARSVAAIDAARKEVQP